MLESSEEGEIKYKKPTTASASHRIIKKIGEGTFGKVYHSIFNNQNYALKKIPTDLSNGISITTLREIKILRFLRHKNIIEIKDILYDNIEPFDRNKCELSIVFPFYKFDLHRYIRKRKLSVSEIKTITRQLCSGVAYMHKKGIIHRDLKSANILMTENFEIKICDFGLAKNINEGEMTPGVVTLWYRAPEILLGVENYTSKIDIWSIGCVVGEMCLGVPLMMGKCEIEQLNMIIYLCGSINEKTFSVINEARNFKNLKLPQGINRIEQTFSKYGKKVYSFIKTCMELDPKKRFTAEDALEHSLFIDDNPQKRYKR